MAYPPRMNSTNTQEDRRGSGRYRQRRASPPLPQRLAGAALNENAPLLSGTGNLPKVPLWLSVQGMAKPLPKKLRIKQSLRKRCLKSQLKRLSYKECIEIWRACQEGYPRKGFIGGGLGSADSGILVGALCIDAWRPHPRRQGKGGVGRGRPRGRPYGDGGLECHRPLERVRATALTLGRKHPERKTGVVTTSATYKHINRFIDRRSPPPRQRPQLGQELERLSPMAFALFAAPKRQRSAAKNRPTT